MVRVRIFRGLLFVGLLFASFAMVGLNAEKAQAAPLTCDGSLYQIRQVGPLNSQLFKINRDVSPYTQTQIGNISPSIALNALGYNKADGYMYALLNPTTAGAGLYRIDDTGATSLGAVSGLPNQAYNAGTFDASGNYFVHPGFGATLYRINTSTLTATPIALSIAVDVSDLSISPSDGLLYGITDTTLYVIDPSSGTTTSKPVTNVGSPIFGTSFFDATGEFYAYDNAGMFYAINTASGTGTLVSTAPSTVSSDGASCVFPDQRIDVVKSASAALATSTTTFEVPFTVKLGNTGTVTNSNVQVSDRLSDTFSSGSPTISIKTPGVQVTSGSCTASSSYDGTTNYNLLNGNDDMTSGSSCTITFTVLLSYATASNVPSSNQLNTAYASTTSLTTNPGHSYLSGGVVIPPADSLNADPSTSGATLPSSPHADTPSPTPVSLVTSVIGYQSVKLTGDVDGSGSITPGDELTWTIVYINNGKTSVGNFQVTDQLPSEVTFASPLVAGDLAKNTAQASMPLPNSSYDGISTNNFFASPVILNTDGVVSITVRTTVDSGVSGSISNQATGNGNGLAGGVLTDALTQTSDLPSVIQNSPFSVAIPSGSISQTMTGAYDPTVAAVVAASSQRVEVVKSSGVPLNTSGTTYEVPYTLTVGNGGGSMLTNVQLVDNLALAFPLALSSNGGNGVTIKTGSFSVTNNGGATTCAGPSVAYDGITNLALLAGNFTLASGQSCVVQFVAVVDFGGNTVPSEPQNNSAVASTRSSSNPGHTYTGTTAVAPSGMVDSDTSTNSFTTFAMVPGAFPPTPSIPSGTTTDEPGATPAFLRPLVGVKSVQLKDDVDNNGKPSRGDTLAWTVIYANTSNASLSSVTITDTLANGLSVTSVGSQIVTATGAGTVATANPAYSGSGTNASLLASGASLGVDGSITVKFDTLIASNYDGSTINNQASALATGVTTPVLTDAADTSYGVLAPSVTIPSGSITQVNTLGSSMTVANIVNPGPVAAIIGNLVDTGVPLVAGLIAALIGFVAFAVHKWSHRNTFRVVR